MTARIRDSSLLVLVGLGAAGLALLLTAPMNAQLTPASPRYAVVDMIYVFNNFQQVMDINDVFC